MPLILTVRSVEPPGAVAPLPIRLDRRGAVIGRAAGNDWVLPDERSTVSSRHCEIAFRDGAYLIADTSTNGTAVNGRRLAAVHRLSDGDVIGIGPYAIVAAITPDLAAGDRPPAPPPAAGGSPAEPLLRAAGIRRGDVAAGDAELLGAAGAVLRAFADGTATLRDRRARARSELGLANEAAGPLDGGAAGIGRLLASPSPERAVAGSMAELEAHQLAALKAMQGAMKATLDTFAPAAIRARAGAKGGDAALWQEYERAFGAAAGGFADVFAREFRSAYEALAKRGPSQP